MEPETEPETESVPETEPEMEPSATETQPAEKKGCASTVQPGLLLLIIAILPMAAVRRKKETE